MQNSQTVATDIAFGMAVVGAFGTMFLYTAMTGREYHTMERAWSQSRIIALLGAWVVLGGVKAAALAMTGVSLDQFLAANIEWLQIPVIGWLVCLFNILPTIMLIPATFVVAIASCIEAEDERVY